MPGRAAAFFVTHVEPSIHDYIKQETVLHRAMAVASNLAHMADYFFDDFSGDPSKVLGATSLKDFRTALCKHSKDFALLRDVCDAHKHLSLNRADRSLTSAGQSTVQSLGWGKAKWGDARWGSPPEVVVVDDSGSNHHFRGLVKRTEEMWKNMLGMASDA